jgi:hypothetical protein
VKLNPLQHKSLTHSLLGPSHTSMSPWVIPPCDCVYVPLLLSQEHRDWCGVCFSHVSANTQSNKVPDTKPSLSQCPCIKGKSWRNGASVSPSVKGELWTSALLTVCAWRNSFPVLEVRVGENVWDFPPPRPPLWICFSPDESPGARHHRSRTEHVR